MASTPADPDVAGLTARWADIVFQEEATAFLPVEGDGTEEGGGEVEESWGVVGRFLTRKLVRLEFMSQVLASVWQPVSGVEATEVEPGRFLFVFHHVTDMERVLNEGPWSFDNSTLVCKQVPNGVMPVDVVLDTVDLWVQLHGLPNGYSSSRILEQIGNFLGTFVKYDDHFDNAP
ncbi:PREDICTED: uncharacterized protein LOC109183147 [Ipomoea nil]|uniref:uncharacterized protein LOC109183147 n=1 Tax=Ipomoea nil TaxID=35883 RepID=UPI0009015AA0|nr:PREDICTED: uncharacterized protein LOC109183147 [Ipomoea nil]